jgi:hypothetical protein
MQNARLIFALGLKVVEYWHRVSNDILINKKPCIGQRNKKKKKVKHFLLSLEFVPSLGLCG